MQLHKLEISLNDYRWMAVEGFHLREPLKIDRVLNQMQTITEQRKVALQIIESKYLAGPRHAFHAGNLAVTAHREKRARAKRIEVELLLYLTGRRQIGDAISLAGVKKETREIAALALGPSENTLQSVLKELGKTLHAEPDDKLLDIGKAKQIALQELFEISNEELALMARNGDRERGLLKCVMERGAMLDALKK